jgi:hypothetical protein
MHLEPASHPHLHDRLRLTQLSIRHPHLHYPPPRIPRQRHPARSGWFIESAITEPRVTLTLRTDRPFCDGGAHTEFIAGLLDRMTADAETIDWWERAAPLRHQ